MKKTILTLLSAIVLAAAIFTGAFVDVSTVRAQEYEFMWEPNPLPLPNPTHSHASVCHNGKIYVIGGTDGVTPHFDTVYFGEVQQDGTISAWNDTTPLPEGRTPAAVVWNNTLYVIGGSGPVWDGRSEQWTVYYAKINPNGTLGDWMNAPHIPERLVAHGAAVWNGRIYVVGGWSGYSHQDEVYCGEILSNGNITGWSICGHLPKEMAHMGVIAHDNVLYIIAGELYTRLATDKVYFAYIKPGGSLEPWNETTPLPVVMQHVRSVLLEDYIYVIGGTTGIPDNWVRLDTVYSAPVLDGGLGNWTEASPLPEERVLHSAVTCSSRIYVIGGLDQEDLTKDTVYYSSTELTPTLVFFNINPNPTTPGQTITLKGVLIDECTSRLGNETVELYVRPLGAPSWRHVTSLTTNTCGVFMWQVTIPWTTPANIYIFAVYYPGSETYESCYNFDLLVVQ